MSYIIWTIELLKLDWALQLYMLIMLITAIAVIIKYLKK